MGYKKFDPFLFASRSSEVFSELFDTESRSPLTVTQITRSIQESIEENIGQVWIIGEVSNCSKPTSGHIYFTLKDENSQISAVMFRSEASRLKFELEDGIEIICFGRITVYEPRGIYQIIVEYAEPRGIGALQKAFEQLKAKLAKEGLFNPEYKKPLPYLPQRIGIVTSLTGAAIKDIINVCKRRAKGIELILRPVKVQGEGAAEEIAKAIQEFGRTKDVDVLIVGRGGGSMEDLWPFNEEVVARAIFECPIPIISAVGHEIDISISDLVADRRALTPTEAAEIAVPDFADLYQRCETLKRQLIRQIRSVLTDLRSRLDTIRESRTLWSPIHRMQETYQRLDELSVRLKQGLLRHYQVSFQKIESIAGRLEALSPLKILARGYSITTKENSVIPIIQSSQVSKDDILWTRIGDGSILISRLLDIKKSNSEDYENG